ncbi:alpha-amylase family glycosyl hydrolase [Acholeplasma granularum]|uniref:alpha-amylase family glycosyl hydrolase n=1 Tax=Acholeplasma granularum TaxID=264635 RepID=UPI00046F4526|nr:alpha-amylase family glycosyl hydrolase [Acholeplasma granularum]
MKKILFIITILLSAVILIACEPKVDINPPIETTDLRLENPRNDIYYQIFIRSFADSNGDGIGDFNGVTNNLDYLEDLGITAIWMLPFNDTDNDFGSHHGYRIKDYYNVNSEYGTMEDLENLISEANKRNIRVMMDLVINHTSDTHPWYIDAKNNTNSEFRDYYIWTSENNAFESFSGGMKDLNLNNEKVVEEIKNIIEYWINKGITGFRYDAAKHFFIGDPNSNPAVMTVKTHQFIRELQLHARSINEDVYFLGEVFEYDYNFYKDYYIGLDSLFDFYTAREIWQRVGSGNDKRLFVSNLERAYATYRPYNRDYAPSIFISNHDLDRVASMSEFGGLNALNKLKLAASVTLTLPGSTHIYYGEELGMKGIRYEGLQTDQGTVYDQYRRSPFLWGEQSKMTTWLNPYAESHSTKSVLEQSSDENSLLNHYKALIDIRKNNPALMYGNYFKAWKDNTSFLQGYVRHYEFEDINQTILVIHNMTDSQRIVDLADETVLYGDLEIKPYGTLILELDSNLIANYINE